MDCGRKPMPTLIRCAEAPLQPMTIDELEKLHDLLVAYYTTEIPTNSADFGRAQLLIDRIEHDINKKLPPAKY